MVHGGEISLVLRRFAALRAYLPAIAAGVATFAAVYGIDAFLARIELPAEATIFDDTLLGILVAVLVIVVQRQTELRRQQHKLAVMKEMNHHIRNALQIIVYTTSNANDRDGVDKVRDAAKRIEWALREVLPAEPRDTAKNAGWPPVPPKNSR
jgi:uncharacterized membrane protein YccC